MSEQCWMMKFTGKRGGTMFVPSTARVNRKDCVNDFVEGWSEARAYSDATQAWERIQAAGYSCVKVALYEIRPAKRKKEGTK